MFGDKEKPRGKPKHGRPRKKKTHRYHRKDRAPNPASKRTCSKCSQVEKSAIPNAKHRGCGGVWR